MAGGIGSRFWPMSRNDKPKQFLDILGSGRTMIQETCERFSTIVPTDHFFVVTGERFADLVKAQLPSLPPANILTEPERRNTAPCIAYAAYKIHSLNPDAVMVVTPSDHHIGDIETFRATIRHGIEYVVERDVLLTLGIEPTFPATGYGYIERSETALASGCGPIVRFKEKPGRSEAEELLASGRYLWNSGMFIWKVRDIIAAIEQYLPEVARLFAGIRHYGTTDEKHDVAQAFLSSPSISIDYGVMEKADNVHIITGDFGWDDIGTWESLYRHIAAHPELIPMTHTLEHSPGTLIRTHNPHKQVIVSGLDNYIVVDMDDILVIAPKGDEAALHELLNRYAR